MTATATATQLTTALETLLTGHHIGIYVGDVPTAPPADTAGRVKPYAALYPTTGWLPAEAKTIGGDAEIDSGLEWPVQVTVAAADFTSCLTAAGVIRGLMAGARLVTGAGPLTEDTTAVTPLRDDDVKPARWFVPLLWRCSLP